MTVATSPPRHRSSHIRAATMRVDNNRNTERTAEQRAHELARLVPLWPAEIADTSLEGRRRLVGKLERVLRAERQRGLCGHWTYDLTRHAELLTVYRAEAKALKTALATPPGAVRPAPLPLAPRILSFGGQNLICPSKTSPGAFS